MLTIANESWSVFDVRPLPGAIRDPRLAGGWLCFERFPERRRLSPVPIGWQDFSDEYLLELWHRAIEAFKPSDLGL